MAKVSVDLCDVAELSGADGAKLREIADRCKVWSILRPAVGAEPVFTIIGPPAGVSDAHTLLKFLISDCHERREREQEVSLCLRVSCGLLRVCVCVCVCGERERGREREKEKTYIYIY